MAPLKEARTWEFGDFQTPRGLAETAVAYLRECAPDFQPATIIEPTCGAGAFLFAAADAYPQAKRLIGLEVDRPHFSRLRATAENRNDKGRFSLLNADFFKTDWRAIIADAPQPVLVVGNPPWVTSADIGRLKGANLPQKSNFNKYVGLDAITGKSNFDISEWMILKHLQWLKEHSGCVAVLCKSSVARRILRQTWKSREPAVCGRMVQIDAKKHFGAAVDACLFMLFTNHGQSSTQCSYFQGFESARPRQVFGFHEGKMLADVPAFTKHRNLLGVDPHYVWRSGVKHDCAKVMELKISDVGLINGYNEQVNIEAQYLFPLLKSSDLGNGRIAQVRCNAIVTQSYIGQPTETIKENAPRTWAYLESHGQAMDGRASVIYRRKPRFSIFGVGDYTFADWKIAISGFYKDLSFQIVGPINDKPVVFDDTIYMLAAKSQEEAGFLHALLTSDEARDFLSSMIFWSDKRPVTAEILKRLHIGKLARHLQRGDEYLFYCQNEKDLPLWDNATCRQPGTSGQSPRGLRVP